jgi:hypothetical protein
MVALPHINDFKLLLVYFILSLILVVGSMVSQNPDNWELLLSQLPDDPIQFFQPSTSRWRVQNEVETSKYCVQPHLDSSP